MENEGCNGIDDSEDPGKIWYPRPFRGVVVTSQAVQIQTPY